ncbi:Brf1-like TBP-binding domain-containing protein [Cladophialophora immunda]|nr:Brf1-like TBP-binding domain-containing protein [Cladophialophora immunda]
MASYIALLGIRQAEVESAERLFEVANSLSFIQGRTIESVAVACLYAACRRKTEQVEGQPRPMYSLMLIDFAEKMNMDVFALGRVYQDLVKRVFIQRGGGFRLDGSAEFWGMDPATLVPRFVDELDFDKHDRDKIKRDAINIVKRMKRDWIGHGRRPSGVCGAAVILAARMNNYRRTTREVVLTAKVTEITINKRLEEFHDTQASKLSVTKFRSEGIPELNTPHPLDEQHPPVIKQALNPKAKNKKRGRPRKAPLPETAAEIEGDATSPEPQATQQSDEGQPPPAKRVRIDAEGYKIPEIPARRAVIDPSLTNDTPVESQREQAGSPPGETPSSTQRDETQEDSGSSQPRQRRHKSAHWKAPPASAAEIAIETEIEEGIAEALRDNPELDPNYEPSPTGQGQAQPPNGDQTSEPGGQPGQEPTTIDLTIDPTQTVPPHPKDKRPGPPCNTNIGNLGTVSLSPTLKAAEFDSDEDVSTCLLSEQETRVKERVWVSMNADWLRQDHAKKIKKELKEADMRARGLDPEQEERRKKMERMRRKDGTRRPGRRGDVSYLREQREGRRRGKNQEGEGGNEGADVEGGAEAENEGDEEGEGGEDQDNTTVGGRERSAAKSMRLMLMNRRTFSRRINYDALEAIYGMSSTTSEDSESRSVTGEARSRSQSVAAQSDTTATPGPGGGERDRREGSRESSVASTAASIGPSAIFRGNVGRERKASILAAERREKKRRERKDLERAGKSATTAAARGASRANDGEASRSGSRSRSASTPVSEGEGEGEGEGDDRRDRAASGPSPEPGPRHEQQQQLPSPPRTQSHQIPGIKTSTLPPSSAPQAQGPGRIAALTTAGRPAAGRGGNTAEPDDDSHADADDADDNDEEAEEEEEEDEEASSDSDDGSDEDDDDDADKGNREADEDVDAAFEGRYAGR